MKKHRAKKAEKEAAATVTVTAETKVSPVTPDHHSASPLGCERTLEHLQSVYAFMEKDVQLAARIWMKELLAGYQAASRKRHKADIEALAAAALKAGLSPEPPTAPEGNLPTGTHAGQVVFDSPQEAHNYRAEQSVDDPTALFEKLAANKAAAKKAKKAAADAEQVMA
jgi:hypothetical protein